MPSIAAPEPEDRGTSYIPPARVATVAVDELGISIHANLRITGVTKDVGDLFRVAPPADCATLLERAIVVGATTIAATAELTATDAARNKLAATAEAVEMNLRRLADTHERHMASVEQRIKAELDALRQQVKDGREQDQQLRGEILRSQREINKAATEMNVSRSELQEKATKAIGELVDAQTKTKDFVVRGTEQALRKLVDDKDPASAPALIKGVVDSAATDMRETTKTNVAELEAKLTALLGEGSPLVARVATLVRESTEREIKRLEEQLDRLRTDVIAARTRDKHDPNVRGDGYEDNVLDLLGAGSAVHGWTVIGTGTETGDEARSKKGDHLILDQSNEAIAAVEARARKNVSARALFDGLCATAANRGVKIVAYFASSSDELPTGMGEFSRGRVPVHHKQLPDGVHALATVIDPTSDTVIERLALVLWFISQLHEQAHSGALDDNAAARINRALPCLAHLETRLSVFRGVKGGLTSARGTIDRVRSSIVELETWLGDDLSRVIAILNGTAPGDATDRAS